eukprot:GILJ01005158.1.p1 GENE.GILJ01005158.1~~GILJ01005158.1.p1  ORF type:complete len:347 (-),score=25.43 GILJ01005158.1:329-1369(-)
MLPRMDSPGNAWPMNANEVRSHRDFVHTDITGEIGFSSEVMSRSAWPSMNKLNFAAHEQFLTIKEGKRRPASARDIKYAVVANSVDLAQENNSKFSSQSSYRPDNGQPYRWSSGRPKTPPIQCSPLVQTRLYSWDRMTARREARRPHRSASDDDATANADVVCDSHASETDGPGRKKHELAKSQWALGSQYDASFFCRLKATTERCPICKMLVKCDLAIHAKVAADPDCIAREEQEKQLRRQERLQRERERLRTLKADRMPKTTSSPPPQRPPSFRNQHLAQTSLSTAESKQNSANTKRAVCIPNRSHTSELQHTAERVILFRNYWEPPSILMTPRASEVKSRTVL